MIQNQKAIILSLFIFVTLACVTNRPIASVATPRPTRTPVPTFTITPLPPTATPKPLITATVVPLAEVQAATEVAASDTPVPTDTPLPTEIPTATLLPPTNTPPPPPPPTETPIPPTPTLNVITNNSPLAGPTNTPQPNTPPGRYEELLIQGENNCADMGLTGWVRDKGNDQPIPNVMVEVRGEADDDDDAFDGPFVGVSDGSGNYSVYIGPIDNVGSRKFEAKVVGGAGVISEDSPQWETSKDCHNGNAIQVMRINWGQKN